MQRRLFLQHGALALTVGALSLAGCSTSVTPTSTPTPGQGNAASAADRKRIAINTSVDASLARLRQQVNGAGDLLGKASGVLVFPSVIQAGLVIGGQYGEGALRAHNATQGYYSLASASIGLQIGAQSKAVFLLFMTQDALDKFRGSHGWSVGLDASVAVLKVGANGNLEVPGGASVLAFVLTNAGLMANLNLEGSKITPLTVQ
jgi:lipid-binding SYLF domain-containing protein